MSTAAAAKHLMLQPEPQRRQQSKFPEEEEQEEEYSSPAPPVPLHETEDSPTTIWKVKKGDDDQGSTFQDWLGLEVNKEKKEGAEEEQEEETIDEEELSSRESWKSHIGRVPDWLALAPLVEEPKLRKHDHDDDQEKRICDLVFFLAKKSSFLDNFFSLRTDQIRIKKKWRQLLNCFISACETRVILMTTKQTKRRKSAHNNQNNNSSEPIDDKSSVATEVASTPILDEDEKKELILLGRLFDQLLSSRCRDAILHHCCFFEETCSFNVSAAAETFLHLLLLVGEAGCVSQSKRDVSLWVFSASNRLISSLFPPSVSSSSSTSTASSSAAGNRSSSFAEQFSSSSTVETLCNLLLQFFSLLAEFVAKSAFVSISEKSIDFKAVASKFEGENIFSFLRLVAAPAVINSPDALRSLLAVLHQIASTTTSLTTKQFCGSKETLQLLIKLCPSAVSIPPSSSSSTSSSSSSVSQAVEFWCKAVTACVTASTKRTRQQSLSTENSNTNDENADAMNSDLIVSAFSPTGFAAAEVRREKQLLENIKSRFGNSTALLERFCELVNGDLLISSSSLVMHFCTAVAAVTCGIDDEEPRNIFVNSLALRDGLLKIRHLIETSKSCRMWILAISTLLQASDTSAAKGFLSFELWEALRHSKWKASEDPETIHLWEEAMAVAKKVQKSAGVASPLGGPGGASYEGEVNNTPACCECACVIC